MNEICIYAIARANQPPEQYLPCSLNISSPNETGIKLFFIDLHSKVILKFFMKLKK